MSFVPFFRVIGTKIMLAYCTVLPALRCHLRFLAIKPFLLGVKTSGFKRKLCFIESTIVPSYNSIMGAIFEYDKNKA